MKRRFIYIFVFLIFGTTIVNGGVTEETRTVEYGDQEKNITVLWTDLNSNRIRVESVLAEGKIGQVDEMMDIYESSQDTDGYPLAAINGTFFNAYGDMQVEGTILSDGQLKHISNSGSVFKVDKDNGFVTQDVYSRIVGGLKGQWDWPNNWYAWNINHWYDSSDATMLFDKNYQGPKPDHNYTAIEVDKKIVTNIEVGGFHIPDDGFLILTNDQAMIAKFQIGIEASYRIEYYENDFENGTYKGDELDFAFIRTMVGAGPSLIRDGIIIVDPEKEGFTEEKINESRTTRSLIGVDSQGRLGMAVVSEVSVYELAEIAASLGMVEALNLDGGGSSGLIIDGQYIYEPGRELSNIVVIKELMRDPIRIELNSRELFFDTEPYIDSEYDRTLVPLRGICEALGATVGWDANSESISISRYGTELLLKVGSNEVSVNGNVKNMEVAVIIKDSRSYVPVRFVTEFLGGKVGWIQDIQTVTLDIVDVDAYIEKAQAALEANNKELAITEYLKVLDIAPNHSQTLKALGDIYTDLDDFEDSVFYYEKYIDIDPSDTNVLSKLGWSYYDNHRFDDSIRVFSLYTELEPTSYQGYYGLAVNYAHYQLNDVEMAKKYYLKAIDLGLTGTGLDVANAYLDSH